MMDIIADNKATTQTSGNNADNNKDAAADVNAAMQTTR
jgi:hypothetical protein